MRNKSSKKPSASIGHVFLKSANIKTITKFYVGLGLRKIWEGKEMAIVELRGGTHILFFKNARKFKRAPKAKFDLMVDNVPNFHKKLKKAGKVVTAIQSDDYSGHKRFSLTDPDGRVVTIFSSHTEGRRV